MKILTKDFQALKGDNLFEFNSGINMIIGPNGSGKSSLFYAVENCLENPNGVDDCINFESNSACVTIENNQQSLSWIRERGSSTYKNNLTNETFVKASKLSSSNICDLGFYFDKKGRVMNIHNEWSVLFPFGESDNDMFRLFEDIFNISCSFEILDDIKKDEQELKGNIKKHIIDKEAQEHKLNILNDIITKVNIIDIDNIISDLTISSQSKETLQQDYDTYKINYPLKEVILPGTFDISLIYDVYYRFNDILDDLNKYVKAINIREIKIPTVEPIDFNYTFNQELQSVYEQYCSLKSTIVCHTNELNSLENKKVDINSKISKIKVCPTCGRPLENQDE